MGLLLIDEQFLPLAVSAVTAAKKSIFISTFKLEISDKPKGKQLKDFFSLLAAKAAAGVKVRVLFNYHENRAATPRTNIPASAILKRAGIEVKYLKDNRCCHAKIVLVDKTTAILGSHNLSIMSCTTNFEVSYLVPDPEVINQLTCVCDELFKMAKKV